MYIYIYIYQNMNITKKTCCISPNIVPTDCFACEAHQGTQQKSNIIYIETNKISKN